MKKIVKLCGVFLVAGGVSTGLWQVSSNHLVARQNTNETGEKAPAKSDRIFSVDETKNDDYQVQQQGRPSDSSSSSRTRSRPQPRQRPRPQPRPDDLEFPVIPQKPKIGFIIPPQNLNEYSLAIKACGPKGPSIADAMHSYWTLVDAIDKTIEDGSAEGYSMLFLNTVINIKYPLYLECIRPDARELRSFAQYNKLKQLLLDYEGRLKPYQKEDGREVFESQEFALNLWIIKNVNLKRGISHASIFSKLKEIFIDTRAENPEVSDDTIEALWKEQYIIWEARGLFLL